MGSRPRIISMVLLGCPSCFGLKLRQRGHHRRLGVEGLSSQLPSLLINSRKGPRERGAIREGPPMSLLFLNKANFPTPPLLSGLLSSLTSPWGFRGDSWPPLEARLSSCRGKATIGPISL